MSNQLPIPTNAVELLDTLLTRLREFSKFTPTEAQSYLSQTPNEQRLTRSFPRWLGAAMHDVELILYQWCDLDPLEYLFQIKSTGNHHHVVFRRKRRDRNEPDLPVEIPEEIATVSTWFLTGCLEGSVEIEKQTFSLEYLCEQLERFRSTLLARSKITESDRSDNNPPVVFRHNGYYRNCNLLKEDGSYQRFDLTSRQAEIVQVLHQAYQNGFPEMTELDIMERVGYPDARMRNVFRRLGGGLSTLIVRGKRKGSFKLNILDSSGLSPL